MKERIGRIRKKDILQKQGRKGRSLFVKKGMYSCVLTSKADAQMLVGLLGKKFCPNEATLEARKMNESISRLVVK